MVKFYKIYVFKVHFGTIYMVTNTTLVSMTQASAGVAVQQYMGWNINLLWRLREETLERNIKLSLQNILFTLNIMKHTFLKCLFQYLSFINNLSLAHSCLITKTLHNTHNYQQNFLQADFLTKYTIAKINIFKIWNKNFSCKNSLRLNDSLHKFYIPIQHQ